MRRDIFHQPPDRELREPAGDKDRGRDPPTASSETFWLMRSSTIFGSATVTMLKASPAPSAITMNNPKMTNGERLAHAHLRRGFAFRGVMPIVRDDPEIGNAGRNDRQSPERRRPRAT